MSSLNQPGANVYTQGFGSRPENVEVPHYDVRVPTSTDLLYPVGKRWIYTNNSEYVLLGFESDNATLTANWELVSTINGDVTQITTDSGIALPSAGNITISGGTTGLTTVASTDTVDLTGTLAVAHGGTGVATLAANGVLIGEGTTHVNVTAAGTTGQVLTATTSADPAFAALGTNSGLTGILLGNNNSAFTATTYTAAGIFTPAFALGTPGDSAWTYSSRVGRYTRLGAVVYFTAQLVWSNFTNSTGSGTWQLNLPVTSGSFALTGQVGVSGSGIDATAETLNLPANFLGVIGSAASTVVLSVQEGGTSNAAAAIFNLTVSQVLTAGTLNISGFYFAA